MKPVPGSQDQHSISQSPEEGRWRTATPLLSSASSKGGNDKKQSLVCCRGRSASPSQDCLKDCQNCHLHKIHLHMIVLMFHGYLLFAFI